MLFLSERKASLKNSECNTYHNAVKYLLSFLTDLDYSFFFFSFFFTVIIHKELFFYISKGHIYEKMISILEIFDLFL